MASSKDMINMGLRYRMKPRIVYAMQVSSDREVRMSLRAFCGPALSGFLGSRNVFLGVVITDGFSETKNALIGEWLVKQDLADSRCRVLSDTAFQACYERDD